MPLPLPVWLIAAKDGDGEMTYGHGPSIADKLNSKPAKSAFVMGTRVIYKTRSGKRVPGQVVGPDQDYFPSPNSVFVSFPSTGFTHLLPVTDLEVAERAADGH